MGTSLIGPLGFKFKDGVRAGANQEPRPFLARSWALVGSQKGE